MRRLVCVGWLRDLDWQSATDIPIGRLAFRNGRGRLRVRNADARRAEREAMGRCHVHNSQW